MPFRESSFVRNGKYVLIHPEPIGLGGLGQVYHVRDVGIDRDVAVKEVLPSLHPNLRSQAIEKFRHEARLHSSLKHEHIVLARTLEIDPETSEQYLVCDFVAGTSLADRLKWGRLPAETAIRITLELLAALDYLHERLVIHRDIKPSNILLATDGQNQITQALLADFGIARNLRVAGSTIGPGTVPSLTPEYCAPEQVNPALMLDPRTDLYSLGLVLGEMLCAEGPYKLTLQLVGGNAWPFGGASSLQGRDARILGPIIVKATCARPEQRYQSARAFMRDLEQASRRTATQRSARQQLGPVLIALSFVLFLLLVPLLALGQLQGPRAPAAQGSLSTTVDAPTLTTTSLTSAAGMADTATIATSATSATLTPTPTVPASTPTPTAPHPATATPTAEPTSEPTLRPGTSPKTPVPGGTHPALLLVPW